MFTAADIKRYIKLFAAGLGNALFVVNTFGWQSDPKYYAGLGLAFLIGSSLLKANIHPQPSGA